MWKFILLTVIVSTVGQRVINTAQGKLRGIPMDGYVSYSGIPYATINSSAGRFQKGGVAPTWRGVRESQQRHCTLSSRPEECLHLDVHVPAKTNSPWPVLVWVKGGSGQYHPGKLVGNDIIVVIVSHRIGPIGFLGMNNEKIPGNAGVKDVILALQWVRDNIVAFKGNPNKVVVAGQSFGAAMVEALMLSPISHNLYHGVILQSGSIMSPWAFNYDIIERATALGKLISSSDNISSILINSDIGELVSKCDKLDAPYFPFGISVDKSSKNEGRLLGDAPFELLKRKDRSVPMMIGHNSEEAYVFVSMLRQANVRKKLAKDLSFLLPEELKFMNEWELKQVFKQIEDMYFKDNTSLAAMLIYHRDAYFVNHIHRSVSLHASASDHSVYYYQFSYTGNAGVKPEPGIVKMGAAHSDELAYLFSNEVLDGEDVAVQQRMVQLWSNFVKYLNPTPQPSDLPHWETVNPSNPRLLDISTEVVMMEYPYRKAQKMWDEIYEKFYYSRNRITAK
ncbi:cholinesterase-like [Galleria mellonella]|uniref:Cholinesterase-like n=1 Tax=Galleria mellonella TaxID=7137 RepID=A0A6J3CEA8_GALME|nr:cholinesterase-like [Galleria mellonella]